MVPHNAFKHDYGTILSLFYELNDLFCRDAMADDLALVAAAAQRRFRPAAYRRKQRNFIPVLKNVCRRSILLVYCEGERVEELALFRSKLTIVFKKVRDRGPGG